MMIERSTFHCISFNIDYELNEARISKKVKMANYELRIKRIWGSILKMPNYELNEVRIKRDQSVRPKHQEPKNFRIQITGGKLLGS